MERGYGRWVRDVLVWTKAPFLFRNDLVAVDGLGGAERAAGPGEVKRLGKDPVIVRLTADGGARVEVAAPVKDLIFASPVMRWLTIRACGRPAVGAHVVAPHLHGVR